MSGLHLIKSLRDIAPVKVLETGAIVPETGIYRVAHSDHHLPREVVLLKDEHFPRCQKCKRPVLFELIHAAGDIFGQHIFRIYELPEIEESAAAAEG
jgi:hypothetical protein